MAARRSLLFKLAAVSMLALVLPLNAAEAQSAPADQKLRFAYRAEFLGLELGNATLSIILRSGGYSVRGELQNSGSAGDLLEPNIISSRASGAVSPSGADWTAYSIDHLYSKKNKHRVTTMTRDKGAVKVEVAPVYHDLGQPPASEKQIREARDPISSILDISLKTARTGKCDGVWPIFDGKHRYDIVASSIAPAALAGEAGGPLIRCRIKYAPIAGFDPKKPNTTQTLPEAVFWFRPDPSKTISPIVQIEVPLPVGVITLRLKPE